jgi:hypothetical protein
MFILFQSYIYNYLLEKISSKLFNYDLHLIVIPIVFLLEFFKTFQTL